MNNNNVIVTDNTNTLQQLALEKKLGNLDVDITSVVAAVFTGDKSLDERLAYFFTEGNKVPQLYAEIGVSSILKEIYNEHDVLLSEKVKGLYGIKDASVYTFHFLINDLPRLYKDELIPTTLTHDAIDPSGIFVLMMGDVYSIKKNITASFNNYYRNKPEEEDRPLLIDYLHAFDSNISEVANLFNNTQSNHVFKHLSMFAKQLKELPKDDKGNILLGGLTQQEGGVPFEALEAVSENVNGMYSFLKEQTQEKLNGIEALVKSLIEKDDGSVEEVGGAQVTPSFDKDALLEEIAKLFKSSTQVSEKSEHDKEEKIVFINDYIYEPIVAAIKEEVQKVSKLSNEEPSEHTSPSTSMEINYDKIEASLSGVIKDFLENSEQNQMKETTNGADNLNDTDNVDKIVSNVSEQIASSHNRLKEFLLGDGDEGEMFREFIATIISSASSKSESENTPSSNVSISDDDINRISEAFNSHFLEFGKNAGAVSRDEFEAFKKEQSLIMGKLDSVYSLMKKEIDESRELREKFIKDQREEKDAGHSKPKKDL